MKMILARECFKNVSVHRRISESSRFGISFFGREKDAPERAS
jgi:hypothetical protein